MKLGQASEKLSGESVFQRLYARTRRASRISASLIRRNVRSPNNFTRNHPGASSYCNTYRSEYSQTKVSPTAPNTAGPTASISIVPYWDFVLELAFDEPGVRRLTQQRCTGGKLPPTSQLLDSLVRGVKDMARVDR